MDDTARGDVLVAFEYRGQSVQARFPVKGWAAMWLKKNPVNSQIRDWVKAQITLIEAGMFSFEVAFMPYLLTHDGRTMAERITELKLLPAPKASKVVSLPGSAA
jgi:hypothetical protein